MSKHKRSSQFPVFLAIGGGLLLIVTAIMLWTQNAPATSTPEVTHAEETYPEIQRASIEEAKAAFDSGTAVFVDVRSAEAYQASHISGAVNIPSEELEARLGELDKAQWIITYCT